MKNLHLAPARWQPTLIGALIRIRPLGEEDFESLFSAASDPLIWEQHPDQERYQRDRFQLYFNSGMESKGTFVVIDQKSGNIIGSSRFTNHDLKTASTEVGYTFLTRPYWGKGYNRELKLLMLNYAFQFIDTVFFYVGETNYRSQKAMMKIGGTEVNRVTTPQLEGNIRNSVVYQMRKSDWSTHAPALSPAFEQPAIHTSRFVLEPLEESHTQELWELFRDPELHHFVPFEPQSMEKQRERCARWAKRRSPDGSEVWLNWIGRDKTLRKMIAHFQVSIKADGVATIGYLVAKEFQNRGIATEGLEAIFSYLRDSLGVREVKAWTDTRNEASHRLAKKLGMVQVELIKNADHFKGANSDEYVFSKVFE